MTTRQLKTEESILIKHILTLANDTRANLEIRKMVNVLDDGEMGSIRFSNEPGRKYGKDILQVQYIDIDNVIVLITLTEDNLGELFELEFWKTNFDKLINYPSPNKIQLLADT